MKVVVATGPGSSRRADDVSWTRMLDDIVGGAYRLAPFETSDVGAARGIVEQYRSNPPLAGGS